MSFTYEISSLYSYVFNLLGIIIQMSALIVVSALNAIHRVAQLIVVFLCGAFIFLILDYYFLGLTYIIVYVGAIAIQFLFVIMMIQIHIAPTDKERLINITNQTNIQSEKVKRNKKNIINTVAGPQSQIGGIIILLILTTTNIISFNNTSFIDISSIINNQTTTTSITTFFYPTWAIEFKTMTDIETLAIGIAVAYPTAQYLIGIALWAVLIGIVAITRR